MSLRLLRKTHFASTEELPGIVLVTIFRTLNQTLSGMQGHQRVDTGLSAHDPNYYISDPF